MELQRHARSLLKSLTGKGVRCKDATEEVILEGEKQIDRKKIKLTNSRLGLIVVRSFVIP